MIILLKIIIKGIIFEKKIKKDNLELRLTEKEINFLIFFASNKNPVSKNFILKNLWHYSEDSDTHTIETHIHRLRKKILKRFNDNNFIKNNDEGYYIWEKKGILLHEIYFLESIENV